ncbi:hydrolase [Oceanobacillus piezotolerans]|uniref:Hydrolase n=1 Tax=Oceanobacillus piezotolerans TaxID=2448030 RepID=A0A498DPA0_9BACI|nr:hydrolase [Oceanobacillus piezotolerans]RLL46469.1 hydrolase [Oceanobacillus piezotolerans]
MEKKRYFVNIGEGEISQIKYENNDDFVIFATEAEVSELRIIMNHLHDASFSSFLRAHVPIVEYHHDSANDRYDEYLTSAYQLIHDLGVEKTRKHIESMNILSNNHNKR